VIAVIFAAWAGSPAPVVFDRIDLISEDPGRWLLDEAPRMTALPGATGVRWARQIKLSVAIPRASLVLGASLTSQSVSIRRPLTRRAPIYAHGGPTLALGLPRGALVGVEAWRGPVRFGLGLNVLSSATWARPVYDSWAVVPGIGVGIGQPPAPF